MSRDYKKQFGKNTVKRIDNCLDRLNHLRFSGQASHYYKIDLDLCLRGGALLGALHVASSLLEIVVREIAIKKFSLEANSQQSTTENAQREIEAKRNVTFKTIIDDLSKSALISTDLYTKSKAFYDYVRVPIHHGLPLRFVERNTNRNEEYKLICEIFGHDCDISEFIVDMHTFEDVVENITIDLVADSITLLEAFSNVKII
jgi:hypothetical protein